MDYINTSESRAYKEGPKIQASMAPPTVQINPMLLKAYGKKQVMNVSPRKRKTKLFVLGYKHGKDNEILRAPMVVRETDNSFRTANWEERKIIRRDRKTIRYYEAEPFNITDKNDEISVQHTAPPSFNVDFDQ